MVDFTFMTSSRSVFLLGRVYKREGAIDIGLTVRQKEERMMTDAEKIIKRALVEIKCSEPLFASAVAVFRPCEVPVVIPISTDGENLFYNADWIQETYEKRGMKAIRTCILHIMMHCILGHLAEEDSYGCQEGKWLFMDREVGLYMKEFGFLEKTSWTKELVEVLRLCNEIAGKTVSHRSYYKVQRNKKFQKRARSYYRILKTDEHACWEIEHAKVGMMEDDSILAYQKLMSGDGMSLFRRREVTKKWEEIREMMEGGILQNGKKFGFEKGTSQFAAKKEGQKPIDFRVWLRRFFEQNVIQQEDDDMFDHAWYQYGLSMYGDVPLVEPQEEERRKISGGTIFVALDTSGSCAGEIMSFFLTELEALWKEFVTMSEEGEMYLLQCDCEIHKEQRFRSGDIFVVEHLALRGNGGTSFQPVFRRIEEICRQNRVTPKLLVYLTDGYGDYPKEKPDYPVLFVMPDMPPAGGNPLFHLEACDDNMPEWIEKAVIGNPAGKEEQDGNDTNHAGII